MKKYIIANWKSNKTPKEAKDWLDTILDKWSKNPSNSLEIVVCAPFIDIPILKKTITISRQIKLGVQNISNFSEGPYTGEVSVRQVAELVSYCLIGHSERRKFFGETDETVSAKTLLAVKHGLIPIICISHEAEIVNWNNIVKSQLNIAEKESIIFAYEPLYAIGTGNPEDPRQADDFIKQIKIKYGLKKCIYGGSVGGKNVSSFIHQNYIDGVLVGSASLKADSFLEVLRNAAH